MNRKRKPNLGECSETVSDSGFWHRYPCQNPATVEVEGKLYCGTHNPIAREKRDQKRAAIKESRTIRCPKCHKERERSWHRHCPSCGTAYKVKS